MRVKNCAGEMSELNSLEEKLGVYTRGACGGRQIDACACPEGGGLTGLMRDAWQQPPARGLADAAPDRAEGFAGTEEIAVLGKISLVLSCCGWRIRTGTGDAAAWLRRGVMACGIRRGQAADRD